ncbi:glycosyltransferase [candidate division KSB3 bacterium]|uniref:Glycosyltransferase n=1 Tax=candidate division KSB3 bacterium TaxID=2044937 RepID=A0A9D5JTV0_9BACT|nr:glycosyltransferase [candidate division KSB3 bacterium]MBD3324004.1 glycosyltransferase [candidate division KSB3 bacterium]
MRILYDGHIYSHPIIGGICRYFNNIIGRLPENVSPILVLDQRRQIPYPVHPNLNILSYQKRHLPASRVFYWLDKYYFRPLSRCTHPDIMHPTYYALLNYQELSNYDCPIVLTVYDMIYEKFHTTLQDAEWHIHMKQKAIQAAQAIICISEHTKHDLLERYAVPEQKVRVIYLASELTLEAMNGSETVPPRPYYLYVGSRAWYKNFDGLLQAFAKAVSVQADMSLCVVGPPLAEPETSMLGAYGLQDHVDYYGYVSDHHLAKLYNQSIALIYPSFYEGFGIPPLEAMACGTAVIASNTSSLPEVIGNAGMLFDPYALDELTEMLLFLRKNPTERAKFVERGRQRVKQFSWETTAHQTLAVYRSLTTRETT